jgi:hypothetical protein
MLTSATSVPLRSFDDGVGIAQRIDVDTHDIVEVHDDVAEVAGEERAPTVGRDLEDLSPAGAVEQQGVGAVLALDRIAAVAGIPLEHVVPGAEQGDVVARAAEQLGGGQRAVAFIERLR